MYSGKGNTNGRSQERKTVSKQVQARRAAQAIKAHIQAGHTVSIASYELSDDVIELTEQYLQEYGIVLTEPAHDHVEEVAEVATKRFTHFKLAGNAEGDDMDPNQALKEIDDALKDGDEDLARELCYGLMEWMEKGGFDPDYDQYPEAYHFICML